VRACIYCGWLQSKEITQAAFIYGGFVCDNCGRLNRLDGGRARYECPNCLGCNLQYGDGVFCVDCESIFI